MSALGQKQTCAAHKLMSALCQKQHIAKNDAQKEFTRFRAAAASPYFLPPFSLQTFVSPTSLPLLQ